MPHLLYALTSLDYYQYHAHHAPQACHATVMHCTLLYYM